MGFARLLNENPPTAVQRDVGPPKLENDSFLPHLPYLAYSCIFQFPPREAFWCAGSLTLSMAHTWRAELSWGRSPWPCCGGAVALTRKRCCTCKNYGVQQLGGAVRGGNYPGGSSSHNGVPQAKACKDWRTPSPWVIVSLVNTLQGDLQCLLTQSTFSLCVHTLIKKTREMPCWLLRHWLCLELQVAILGLEIPMKPQILIPMSLSPSVVTKTSPAILCRPSKNYLTWKKYVPIEITDLDTMGLEPKSENGMSLESAGEIFLNPRAWS